MYASFDDAGSHIGDSLRADRPLPPEKVLRGLFQGGIRKKGGPGVHVEEKGLREK